MIERLKIIDGHMHLVDLSRGALADWPAMKNRLRRDWSVGKLLQEYSAVDVEGFVLVETSREPDNDRWLIELAEQHNEVLGVVLNLQPDQEDFAHRLRIALRSDKFVGVRLRPVALYDLDAACLHASFAAIGAVGKTIEFGATTAEYKRSFARLARTYTHLTWILDHGGHPSIASSEDESWRRAIKEISGNDNVFCKVTADMASGKEWFPVLTFLSQCFGRDRLLYGSNWPVSTASGTLKNALALLQQVYPDNENFFVENARAAYGLR